MAAQAPAAEGAALEVLEELALAHALRVAAEVHGALAPQVPWHRRVDKVVERLHAHDAHHLLRLRV